MLIIIIIIIIMIHHMPSRSPPTGTHSGADTAGEVCKQMDGPTDSKPAGNSEPAERKRPMFLRFALGAVALLLLSVLLILAINLVLLANSKEGVFFSSINLKLYQTNTRLQEISWC